MKTEPSQPTYPIDSVIRELQGHPGNAKDIFMVAGLTKREHFAAMALNGLCLQVPANYEKGACNSAIADRAVVLADTLIKALNEDSE